ncbi:MAG: hypothetical protein ACLT0Y_07690 [Christensenellales bacterium]
MPIKWAEESQVMLIVQCGNDDCPIENVTGTVEDFRGFPCQRRSVSRPANRPCQRVSDALSISNVAGRAAPFNNVRKQRLDFNSMDISSLASIRIL